MKALKALINTLKIVLSISLFMGSALLQAQSKDECKVLLEVLAGTYEGECRKGLANGRGKAIGTDSYEGEFRKGLPEGRGTYTWSNGDVFVGSFKKGMKEGEGKVIFNPDQHADSMLTGFWKKDVYFGLYENPYKVLAKSGPVNRIVIRKLGNAPNDILIRGEMDMLREKGLNSPYFTGSGFDNVQFPFTLNMEANHANVPVTFEVIIYEPGRWEVVVNFD